MKDTVLHLNFDLPQQFAYHQLSTCACSAGSVDLTVG